MDFGNIQNRNAIYSICQQMDAPTLNNFIRTNQLANTYCTPLLDQIFKRLAKYWVTSLCNLVEYNRFYELLELRETYRKTSGLKFAPLQKNSPPGFFDMHESEEELYRRGKEDGNIEYSIITDFSGEKILQNNRTGNLIAITGDFNQMYNYLIQEAFTAYDFVVPATINGGTVAVMYQPPTGGPAMPAQLYAKRLRIRYNPYITDIFGYIHDKVNSDQQRILEDFYRFLVYTYKRRIIDHLYVNAQPANQYVWISGPDGPEYAKYVSQITYSQLSQWINDYAEL